MRPSETVAAYFDAVNNDKWDLLGTLFAVDATYVAMGGRPQTGREEIVAAFPRMFGGWATHRDEPVRVFADTRTAAVDVAFTGTTAGDGRAVAFDAIDFFTFTDDGLIRSAHTCYDVVAVRALVAGGTP